MENEIDFDSPEFEIAARAALDNPAVPIPEFNPTAEAHVEEETPPPAGETSTEAPAEAVTPPAAETPGAVNYDDYFTTKSGGLIKSEADFLAALEKVKNYDSVETKLKDTEAKIPVFTNPVQQKIFEAWVNGQEDEVKAYWAEKDKPYATMSDIDIVRNSLKNDNPTWDDKRVELEMRHKYGRNLEKIDTSGLDPDDDAAEIKEANAHNNEVEKNLELLQMHAFDARHKLIENQKQIGLPELKKTETPQSPQMSEADIAEAKVKWQKGVDDALQSLSNIKYDIDDKGVEYVSTDEDKAALQATMKDFNMLKFFAETRGWANPDKSWNQQKIAEDVRFLTEGQKVVKAVAGQVKTETIRATLAKIKNTDGTTQSPEGPQTFKTFEEAAHDALKRADKKKRTEEWEEQD